MADETSATQAADMPEEVASPVEIDIAPTYERKVDDRGRSYATGKRKDAVARVWVMPGTGKYTINGREGNDYLARPT